MISIDGILDLLFKEGIYNYRELLEDLCCGHESDDPYFRKTVNTVEIFAFGDYIHYLKNSEACIALQSQGIRKLVKSTLVSVCNVNEGRQLSFDDVIEINSLEQALRQMGGDTHFHDILQDLLIEMANEGSIEIQIDDATSSFFVNRSYVARDAYNPNKYSLRVLHESDITSRSVPHARKLLLEWLSTKINPAIQELSGQN